ncbi:MAG: tRNA (adenosine(37)-N6)-threonylcarbamoyltransferase complex transferase subunit TsaD [Planctomycetota bacterium]
MKILGFESSCDDTACSVVEDGRNILSSVVSSQDDLHRRFGGVVPEVASREHIRNVLPVLQQALDEAEVGWEDLDAVAATRTPGLAGSLLIGFNAARAAAWALDVHFVAINHLDAHVYAAWMHESDPIVPTDIPAVSLVVSGGHTNLYRTGGPLEHELIGRTVDDAAGEAFDKVAKILHLGFPGGPRIEETAKEGDPEAFDLPRAMMDGESLDFSFSGLKTAVLYSCVGHNASMDDIENAQYDDQFVANMAASFQEAVVDVLVGKTALAADRIGAASVIVGGGVAANGSLRERMQQMSAEKGLKLHLAPWPLCRDNAAMVAGVAHVMGREGRWSSLSVDVEP